MGADLDLALHLIRMGLQIPDGESIVGNLVHRFRVKDNLLIRCRRELQSVLADINADQIPHDGDDFHELLRDLDAALKPHLSGRSPMRPEPRPESIRETLLLIVEREYDIPVLEALNAESALRARVAELEAKMDSGYQDGRRHACALLSQLVYTSDGEPLDQAALLELCINVEIDYGL